MPETILILHQQIPENAGEDELDVLDQVKIVGRELRKMGYRTAALGVTLGFDRLVTEIRRINPAAIFNLVETIENKGEFAFVATALFNYLKIPYTGSPLIPMFYASNKVLAKKEIVRAGLRTPPWFMLHELSKLETDRQYILKPTWEEGSLDLDEDNVFFGYQQEIVERFSRKNPAYYFVEEFIPGREFNVSILGGKAGPEVLPIPEMTFLDFPDGKPKIMGYTAKWKEDSFEYTHTRRTFRKSSRDRALYEQLRQSCITCWHELGLKGYVRVDFRVSSDQTPYLIDINANPCLSWSGGFMAASKKAGYRFSQVLARILEDAFSH